MRKEPRAGSFGRWRPPAGDDILLIRASFLCDADDTKILNYTRRRLKAFLLFAAPSMKTTMKHIVFLLLQLVLLRL